MKKPLELKDLHGMLTFILIQLIELIMQIILDVSDKGLMNFATLDALGFIKNVGRFNFSTNFESFIKRVLQLHFNKQNNKF